MSIGFQNPIGGTTAFGTSLIISPKSSGGAIKGYMAPQISKVDKDYKEFEHIRFTLTQAWNTSYPSELRKQNLKRIITPFRAITNSGDILARQYYSCGGSCQTFQNRPGLFGLRGKFGSIHSICDGSEVPPASCNGKYVYDSSNYTTFLKQQATNKNFNSLSSGGDESHSTQSIFKAIRRY